VEVSKCRDLLEPDECFATKVTLAARKEFCCPSPPYERARLSVLRNVLLYIHPMEHGSGQFPESLVFATSRRSGARGTKLLKTPF
jgi:hypothetical protein